MLPWQAAIFECLCFPYADKHFLPWSFGFNIVVFITEAYAIIMYSIVLYCAGLQNIFIICWDLGLSMFRSSTVRTAGSK